MNIELRTWPYRYCVTWDGNQLVLFLWKNRQNRPLKKSREYSLISHQQSRQTTEAFRKLHTMTLESRNDIIAAIRASMLDHAAELADLAHSETGLGRVEDKILKNRLVAEKTPGTEILTPTARSGDRGLTLNRAGSLWCYRSDHSVNQSDFDDHLQHDRHGRSWQRSGF